jgi:hypothetical protein
VNLLELARAHKAELLLADFSEKVINDTASTISGAVIDLGSIICN